MAHSGQTPSQTVGPYFSMRLGTEGENMLAAPGVPGERIRIVGTVIDGDDNPVEDALIEIWQANAGGRYRHPDDGRDEIPLDEGFTGFGRAETDFEKGEFWLETVKPGGVPDGEGEFQASHLNVVVQAPGMLNPLFTRIYFPDELEANESDLVLKMVPAERRETLIAGLVDEGAPRVYRFDIKLQGDRETVFFEF